MNKREQWEQDLRDSQGGVTPEEQIRAVSAMVRRSREPALLRGPSDLLRFGAGVLVAMAGALLAVLSFTHYPLPMPGGISSLVAGCAGVALFFVGLWLGIRWIL